MARSPVPHELEAPLPGASDAGTRRRVFGKKGRRAAIGRRAFLLPSLFTVANMLLGFYAVVVGLRGRFALAALLVFAARSSTAWTGASPG